MKILQCLAAGTLAAAALSACHQPQGWGLSGKLEGATDTTLTIEAFNNGMWYVVDSVPVKDGKFDYRAAHAADYPEVMRLCLGDKFIYFPVDSLDNVTVTASLPAFDTEYTLGGTPQARSIQAIDSVIAESVSRRGAAATVADADLKYSLFGRAFDDPSVMSVYYLINRTVDGQPLYDITDAGDRRLYGAVAQRFTTERPADPRTAYLTALYTRTRNAASGVTGATLEASEVKLFEIVRHDAKGKEHSLEAMASKGGVTLLSFTAYGLENSPAYTALLNSLYDRYRDQGLDIYQIAFDGDEAFWKENARNIPWTAVWNSTTDGDEPLLQYNVGALPMTFVIDRTGTLRDRVADPAELEKHIKKYL